MIDRRVVVDELRPLVTQLVDDLRGQADVVPEIARRFATQHQEAVDAGRTAMALDEWREDELTQSAVAWVLACVFVRFIEDNGLIAEPLLSGPGERRSAALGRRAVYFDQHPNESDREYLLWCFEQVAQYPAVAPLFDVHHTRFDWLVPSVDGAAALRDVWLLLDPDSGEIAHDFCDPLLGTRFLGDLYQDLSEAAKKRYALLQTPDFVERFILDHTLDPALDEFGLAGLRLIDPTCGSGHFLISAFERLYKEWVETEPGTPSPMLAQRALDAVHGVDLNPFATAIARFRLIVAALRVCSIERLADAPGFKLNLATGDSLLHGPEHGQLPATFQYQEGITHVYDTEDAPELARILTPGYHVVVGNPPYINVKDAALRDAYRARYRSCHREYALSVPFMERFFQLARPLDTKSAGFVGKITSNSFMRREFGAPLIEQFLPSVDVTALVDLSGAYVPGHGTPTVMLFGRARRPVAAEVRVLDAVRGEPGQPSDPSCGLVWQSVVQRFPQPGTRDRFIRNSDVDRQELAAHPITLGIGRDLRKRLEHADQRLESFVASTGLSAISGENDAFIVPSDQVLRRLGVSDGRQVVPGTAVRDWSLRDLAGVWPYGADLSPSLLADSGLYRFLWRYRRTLIERKRFGRPVLDVGLAWYEWRELYSDKLRTPATIAWSLVATHNHFVLDRAGRVFMHSAPVGKLAAAASGDDHLELLGALNSSVACFWLKQVCHGKGNGGIGGGIADEAWEPFFEFNANNVKYLPLPPDLPLDLAKRVDALARERAALLDDLPTDGLAAHVRALATRDAELFAQMVALQEELDWQVLRSFGLAGDDVGPINDPPPMKLGERAFEIILARHVNGGEIETTWFERHESTAITELPDHWSADYAERVQRRIALIEEDPDVGLIERPEHKRRWNGHPSYARRLDARLRSLVLDRLEAEDLWRDPQLRTISELADTARRDHQLADACALIAGDPDADVGDVVQGLVLSDAVPFLAALRHTEAGLRKRSTWEQVWELQREEDKGAIVGKIPVPPRYTTTDFRSGPTWGLRGKLDVPKERFVLVPGAERAGTTSPVVGWAGWDEGTRARALASKVLELQMQDAADGERLTPLLAGVLELLPWVHQWQPEPDAATGQPLGTFLEDWLSGTLSGLGLTRDQLTDWRLPAPVRGRKRKVNSSR